MPRRTRIRQYDDGDIDNPYYKQHFIQPNDAITDRYREVLETDYYIEHLPISIVSGLANFQEKIVIPMKRIPLYSKLIKGDYHKGHANYDKTNVKDNINFFINNLPSFLKYQNEDKLDWILKYHRLLALEIFDYYKDNEPTPSTLEARFNSILRVIRIAYMSKTSPLYQLFSSIVFQLHNEALDIEGKNKLNKTERYKFIHWLDVLKIQKDMEKRFNGIPNKHSQAAYDLNNDLLLISMYSLIPPLRNEVKHLQFSKSMRQNDKDYIYINSNKTSVILKLNKIKKQHKAVHFDLTVGKFACPSLAEIIKQSYTLYPRQYVFTLKDSYSDVSTRASQRAMDNRLIALFNRYGIKNNVSVNSLRSSYVSYRFSDKSLTYNQKKQIVYQMRTSMVCLERSYNKIVDNEPLLKDEDLCINQENAKCTRKGVDFDCDDVNKNEEPDENIAPPSPKPKKPFISQYEKKKMQNKEYYQKHKQTIQNKIKERNANKTTFERSRERMAQLLNASSDYACRIKTSTIEKYKFYYDEADRRWKWNI